MSDETNGSGRGIEKLDANKHGRTPDLVADNLARMRELFPEVFSEGGVDFEALRQLLGDHVVRGDERYGLGWAGKAEARRIAQTPSTGTLRPVPEESVAWETTQNVFIEGDNLEVLKLLQKSYHRRVKMIYIDPPYNTGKEFIYPDKYQDNLDTYLRYTGQVDDEGFKLSANTETQGRYHTNWLNMMYPRLKLARNLLRDDGVIFVSIDDNEVHNLRHLMDEVFGGENHVETFIWKKTDSPSRNDESRSTSSYHEYILAYARDASRVRLSKQSKASVLDAYPLRLEDGRPARRRQLRKNGKNARREDRPTLWYPLEAPDGSQVYPVAPEGWEGRWVLKRDSWEERVSAGLTEWIQREYGWVPYYIEVAPDEPEVPWPSLWEDLSQNRQAKAEFTALMTGTGLTFDSPKPTDLMARLVELGAPDGGIVLDFFAGTCSAGHGVWRQSLEDGTKRRFILVQLPRDLTFEAADTIAKLGIVRLKVTAATFSETADALDLGFRVFKLDSTNVRPWEGDFDDLEADLVAAIDNIKHGRSEDDVLFELLLKFGLDLSLPIDERTVAGKRVFVIGAGALVVCLAQQIGLDVVEGIAALRTELQPEVMRVVFRDASFANDVVKTNAMQILKRAGISDVKSL